MQSDSTPWCTTDTDGDGIADAGGPAPPPPPTHGEIVAAVCPAPTPPSVGLNPRDFGVTGYTTWIWDAGQPVARSASGSIRGYAVSCTLTPIRWTVDTGDPTADRFGRPRTYTADEPGREADDTPVQHVYETMGEVTVTLTVTWDRTTTAGADALSRTASRDYRVREVRPVPTTAP